MQVLQTQSATSLTAAKDARDQAKLRDAAQQFEAMMLGEMLKPLQFGGAPAADEEGGGGANDTIRSFGTEAVAKAVASHGGFGIARQIIRQVTAEREGREAEQSGTKV